MFVWHNSSEQIVQSKYCEVRREWTIWSRDTVFFMVWKKLGVILHSLDISLDLIGSQC